MIPIGPPDLRLCSYAGPPEKRKVGGSTPPLPTPLWCVFPGQLRCWLL